MGNFLAILFCLYLIVMVINMCYVVVKRIEISWYTFMIVYAPILNLWALLRYKMWKW